MLKKWIRVKIGNKYGYVLTDSKNLPLEYDSNTGRFKVYSLPNISSHSFMSELSNEDKNSRLNSNYIYDTGKILDEVSVIGSRPQYSQKNKGYSFAGTNFPENYNYKSAYHSEDVIPVFNALTAGGFNNLSPTQWTRRAYDAGKLISGDMDWSNYVDSWINGNNGIVSNRFAEEHPYWSLGANLVGDIAALGGIANANKINLVGNIATKHGGNIAKVTIDVAKNSSKPFNWRNYKFLGDSRFYSDLDDVGYKTLMSERLLGNYPLTFAERKNYIIGLKNDIQKGIDYAKQEAVNDVTTPIKKEIVVSPENRMYDLSKINSYSDIQMLTPYFGTLRATKKYGKTPWEGNYTAFQNSKGLFFPFRDEPNTLRTHSMFLDSGERISNGAHEARHTIQEYFDTPLIEIRYDLPGTYRRYTNRKLPLDFKKKVNEYINDALTAGEWEGSLAEMDSELTGWSARYGFPRYSQMNPKQKALLHHLFQEHFGGASNYENYGEISSLLKLNPDYNTSLLYSKILDNNKIGQIIQGLETLGYRKQGGKMNMLEFLKKGSGIHIKEKNKGKFTKYCHGKVTQECINKGKHSKNSAIRKRAVFAENARRWAKKGELGMMMPVPSPYKDFIDKNYNSHYIDNKGLLKNRIYNWDTFDKMYKEGKSRKIPYNTLIALMSNVAVESGGYEDQRLIDWNHKKGTPWRYLPNGGQGLLQYDIVPKNLRLAIYDSVMTPHNSETNYWKGRDTHRSRLSRGEYNLRDSIKHYRLNYVRPGAPALEKTYIIGDYLSKIYPKYQQGGNIGKIFSNVGKFLKSDTGQSVIGLGKSLIGGIKDFKQQNKLYNSQVADIENNYNLILNNVGDYSNEAMSELNQLKSLNKDNNYSSIDYYRIKNRYNTQAYNQAKQLADSYKSMALSNINKPTLNLSGFSESLLNLGNSIFKNNNYNIKTPTRKEIDLKFSSNYNQVMKDVNKKLTI